jgi:predicted secreted protein
MAYTRSQAFSPRGTVIGFALTNVASATTDIDEVKDISFSGAKYDLADVTNFESGNFREWLTTLADSGELSFTANYLPNDATQQQLLTYFNNGTLLYWYVVLPSTQAYAEITFTAYVSSIEVQLPLDKEATLAVKLKITGAIAGL